MEVTDKCYKDFPFNKDKLKVLYLFYCFTHNLLLKPETKFFVYLNKDIRFFNIFKLRYKYKNMPSEVNPISYSVSRWHKPVASLRIA